MCTERGGRCHRGLLSILNESSITNVYGRRRRETPRWNFNNTELELKNEYILKEVGGG